MHLTIKTNKKDEVIDITDEIQKLLKEEEVEEGLCVLFVKHTTCFVTTLVSDSGTGRDLIKFVRSLSSENNYEHPHNPTHAQDHLIASLGGPSLCLPIEEGKIDLGVWQKIVLIELDGPKERHVSLNIFG